MLTVKIYNRTGDVVSTFDLTVNDNLKDFIQATAKHELVKLTRQKSGVPLRTVKNELLARIRNSKIHQLTPQLELLDENTHFLAHDWYGK